MKSVARFVGLAAVAGLMLCRPATAQESGDELMRQANAVMTHFDTVIADVALEIESDGRSRLRSLQMMVREDETKRNLIAEFTAPKEVRNAGFSSEVDLQSGARQSWVYLPAVGKVRKLAANRQAGSFFGSDFSYADIVGRSFEQDTHRYVGEDEASYTVESTPKDKTDPYSKLVSKISKDDMTVREVTFFDRKGAALKRLSHLEFETFRNVPVVAYSEMQNLQKPSVTRLTRLNMQVNVYLMDDDFGPSALSN